MKDLGVSLSYFGYYQGALAFLYALGSLFFSLIINKYDQKRLLYLSGQIFILSLMGFAVATFLDSSNPLSITLTFFPFIIGQVVPSTVLYPLCLNFIPNAKARISALIQGGRLILSALSLQIAGYYYQGSFQNIGIIIMIFLFMVILTLFLVLRNRALMTNPS